MNDQERQYLLDYANLLDIMAKSLLTQSGNLQKKAGEVRQRAEAYGLSEVEEHLKGNGNG